MEAFICAEPAAPAEIRSGRRERQKNYVLPIEVFIALMDKLEDHELALIEKGCAGCAAREGVPQKVAQ